MLTAELSSYVGNSQWAYTILSQNLIGCLTLSQGYCKLIGCLWKIMRRQLWTLICPIVQEIPVLSTTSFIHVAPHLLHLSRIQIYFIIQSLVFFMRNVSPRVDDFLPSSSAKKAQNHWLHKRISHLSTWPNQIVTPKKDVVSLRSILRLLLHNSHTFSNLSQIRALLCPSLPC